MNDTWPKVKFPYRNRILVLFFPLTDCGKSFAPAAILKGAQEPRTSNVEHSETVSDVVPEGWNAFGELILTVLMNIFSRSAYLSLSKECEKPILRLMICSCFDACLSHLVSSAIEELYSAQIATVALPVDISYRLQPFNVPFLGALKH